MQKLHNPPRPLASGRVEAGLQSLVNTGQYWSLDTGKEVNQTPPLPLPEGLGPGVAAHPQTKKTYFSVRRVQKKHLRGRHSAARSVYSSKVSSEKQISENCLDDFHTFRNAGSTEINVSETPDRQFPLLFCSDVCFSLATCIYLTCNSL